MNRNRNAVALVLVLGIVGCQTQAPEIEEPFSLEAARLVIAENGKRWGEGLKARDAAILSGLYDRDAHYLPDGETALHGNEAITAYWESSFGFVNDIQLTMESLEGNRELLYETGHGWASVSSQEGEEGRQQFKYVNVWKLQEDGSYKVVIDIYNDVKSEE